MLMFLLGLINAFVPSDTHFFTPDLAYGPDARQRLDVYHPRAAPPPGGYPLAVFFYGGSWTRGERAQYRFVGEALAARGVVVAIADYRLHPEVSYPAFLEDSAQAVAWVRREAGRFAADPERLFVIGHSAGAYNAAMLALDGRWLGAQGLSPGALAGWIGLAGPYDFLPSGNPDVQAVFHHPRYPQGAQPVEHVSAEAPPALLAAAREDRLVDPERNTRRLAQRLAAAGVPVELRLYDGVNHLSLAGAFGRPLRGLAPVLEDVMAFMSPGEPASSAYESDDAPNRRAAWPN